MTTRRPTKTEKHALETDHADSGPAVKAGESPSTAPAVPGLVVAKLLLFTFLMVVAPLGSYFLTLNTVFKGSNTLAGATAAVVANIVLIAYVIVAMAEDNQEQEGAKKSQ